MGKKKLDLPEAKWHDHSFINPEGKRENPYPGVVYLIKSPRTPNGKALKVYYVKYRAPDGRQHFEKAGKRITTPAKANVVRTARSSGTELPNEDRREAKAAELQAEAERWTFSLLWKEYQDGRPGQKRSATDKTNFTKYLLRDFGDKEPATVVPLDVDRLRLSLSKKKTPGTVKNVLELLRRLSNFAANKCLCAPLPFRVTLPRVNNLRTEDLNAEQTERLLKVLRGEIKGEDDDGNPVELDPDAREMMLLALLSGMRRGEIFRLRWDDADFQRGFLTLRDPKSGTDERIPMSDAVRELLEGRPRTDSPYIFPGRPVGKKKDTPKQFRPKTDAAKHFRAIRKAAGLPKDFRPMHGLRHTFASNLASSGEVDLFTLQRLLTHKSPMMTQRYAHLRDETLKRASNVAGRIMRETTAEQDAKKTGEESR